MKSPRNNNPTFDSWILDEHLPSSPTLKVVRKSDPDYGLTEDEIQDRNESIRCYLFRDFELLAIIPVQDKEDGFFVGDYGVEDCEYNAFNTVDFHRLMRPFNKYDYAMKMIMERVRDLAIMHSSISDEEGRLETYRRYEAFVDSKFRNRFNYLAKQYRWARDEERRFELKEKIGELNRRILRSQLSDQLADFGKFPIGHLTQCLFVPQSF